MTNTREASAARQGFVFAAVVDWAAGRASESFTVPLLTDDANFARIPHQSMVTEPNRVVAVQVKRFAALEGAQPLGYQS